MWRLQGLQVVCIFCKCERNITDDFPGEVFRERQALMGQGGVSAAAPGNFPLFALLVRC